jgi:hypothetical protein
MEDTVVSTPEAKRTRAEEQAPQEEQQWSVQLLNLLKNNTQPPGSFAMTSRLEPPLSPHPMISVQGVGAIGFPLMKCAVEPVKAVATKC